VYDDVVAEFRGEEDESIAKVKVAMLTTRAPATALVAYGNAVDGVTIQSIYLMHTSLNALLGHAPMLHIMLSHTRPPRCSPNIFPILKPKHLRIISNRYYNELW